MPSPDMYLLSSKKRERNLTNIISSNSMQFTVNSFRVMSHYFFIKQNINKVFMTLIEQTH